MNKNILIFQNTEYHFETGLSIYHTLKLMGLNPTILLDFNLPESNFYIEKFLDKNKVNYINGKNFDINLHNNFDKMIVVSAGHSGSIPYLNEKSPPINYNGKMLYFKDRAILVYHRANFYDYLEHIDSYFTNPKALSVTKFSQKYGLDFIHQIENPTVDEEYQYKIIPNEIPEFLFISRFCLKNRELSFFHPDNLIKLDTLLHKKIKITFMGQKNCEVGLLKDIENLELKNIELLFEFNVDELRFYEKIHNSDWILNLIHHPMYYYQRTTSNIHQTIAFCKPSLTCEPLNLIYNIPCIEYKSKLDFFEKIVECADMNKDDYKLIVDNLLKAKKILRIHNFEFLKKLLN